MFRTPLVFALALLQCSSLTAGSLSSQHASSLQIAETALNQPRQAMTNTSSFGLSQAWEVLGPFQIGTREAAWGADPLELYGGFRNLSYDEDAFFLSALPIDGRARWSTLQAELLGSDQVRSRVNLVVSFPDVQWDFLQTVFGWAAVQFQGWVRGYITIDGEAAQPYVLYTDSILEYWLDDVQYFGGDFYTFRKAPPVIWLAPGRHRLDVRLVRDVRAFGGIGEPTMTIGLELRRISEGIQLASESIQISDIVNGKLAGPVASLTLRNAGKQAAEITAVRTQRGTFDVSLLETGIVIQPGQTRPVAFNVSALASNASEIHLTLEYKLSDSSIKTLEANQTLKSRDLYEPHKVTFLHPGGIVSYVMLRPPQLSASCIGHDKLPVLFFFHGAGNEAENDAVARIFDPVNDTCAWALSPTGVTPWSADDWHNWGFADVEAAANAVEPWIHANSWSGPGVDSQKWLVSGHSNGGQGTWYALTHQPDKLIAAAPVSGYLSIQTYVPYHLWRLTDPRLVSVVQAATNSYRHELLIENAKEIPIHQQHGGIDDNVPAYNSRSMHQLLRESGWNSNYTEIPDSPHYFDGVMTTPNLQDFYRSQLASPAGVPIKTQDFTLTVANPGDTGSKQGYRVLLLEDPSQLGQLRVVINAEMNTVEITARNTLRFEIPVSSAQAIVNGQKLVLDSNLISAESYIVQNSDGQWRPFTNSSDKQSERTGRQLGPLDAIMRSRGRFTIRYEEAAMERIALQISRNLHQYYYADAAICPSLSCNSTSGNMFTIATAETQLPAAHDSYPIRIDSAGALTVIDGFGQSRSFTAEEGVAAVFLRPARRESLELVVWAADKANIDIAARLVPLQTGVGQPDFIILRREALWKGIDGVVAAGSFDHEWKVSKTSYFA